MGWRRWRRPWRRPYYPGPGRRWWGPRPLGGVGPFGCIVIVVLGAIAILVAFLLLRGGGRLPDGAILPELGALLLPLTAIF